MLGVAIVGAGVIADVHAAAYQAAGAKVVAVMSRRRASAERLARQVGATLATDDLDEVLADPHVEAIDICTPTDGHASAVIAAARAGRHVHVEKPIALSIEDADAMIEACRRADVKLMVGQTARYHAVSRALRTTVEGGEVGRPFHLELVWNHAMFWPGGWRGWQVDPSRSGGHLVHNGVHAFDLACWLLDQQPVRVFAQAHSAAHPALASPDYWHAALELANGATALCEIGYVLRAAQAVHRTAWLYGTHGTAWHTTADDGVVFTDAGTLAAGLVGEEPMRAQIRDWVECLRENRAPPVPGEAGRLALAVGLAARLSAESGQPEEVVQ